MDSAFPGRNKRSDGTIGDADHQSRTSDHNPWVPPPNGGVVTAIDITHDPANGLDSRDLAEYLRKLGAKGDRRIKYIISHKRITSGERQWKWGSYSGSNPHTSHVHLSVSSKYYDDSNSWGIYKPRPISPEEEVISRETHGEKRSGEVNIWQRRLNQTGKAGEVLQVDGFFGPSTEKAVKTFQKDRGLPDTGIINLTTAVQVQAFAHNEENH